MKSRHASVLLLVPAFIWSHDPASAQAPDCRFLLDNCTGPRGSDRPPPPSAEAYDPVNTAKAFYIALSRADGSSAAAFVVPEKRGIGPFNPGNIAQFF